MGIEPTYPAWKAGVLPLNYTRTLCYVLLFTAATMISIPDNHSFVNTIFEFFYFFIQVKKFTLTRRKRKTEGTGLQHL